MESGSIDIKTEVEMLRKQVNEMQVALKDFEEGVTDFSKVICSTLSMLCEQENLSKDVVMSMATMCDFAKRMSDLFKMSDEQASGEKIMYG